MLEKLKFVPMARPYASDIPISLFISTSTPPHASQDPRGRPAPDKTNERARPIRTGTGCGRISGIRSFPEHVRNLLGPKARVSGRSLGEVLGLDLAVVERRVTSQGYED